MTPEACKIAEKYPSTRIVLQEYQYYDLTRVEDLVFSMSAEYDGKEYPAFQSGDLPSEKTCFRFSMAEWLCVSEGETRIAYIVSGLAVETQSEKLREIVKRAKALPNPPLDLINKTIADLPDVFDNEPREHESCIRGEILAADKIGMRIFSCACDLISQQNLFVEIDGQSPRPFRRRLEREGVAAPIHRVIDFARSHVVGHATANDGEVHRKALHFCSGHWRHSEGPKSRIVHGTRKTWIDGHWRGDPALGTVTKTYVAGRKFLTAIRSEDSK